LNWVEFGTIAVAHLFAVASPGPDFAIVLRQTLKNGSFAGLWSSAGVAAGIGLHVTYCLLGVALIIASSPTLFLVLKLGAAVLLVILGGQSLYGAAREFKRRRETSEVDAEVFVSEAEQPSMSLARRAFLTGFTTNGLNPKATLFFLALFSVVIDPATGFAQQTAYGLYLVIATFAWFACLALLVGRPRVRLVVLSAAPVIDSLMGLILWVIAAQLLS